MSRTGWDCRCATGRGRRRTAGCCAGAPPGLEQAAAEPFLPFFIEWAEGTPLPGRAAVTHPGGLFEITELALVGDGDRLAAWLGGHALPVTIRPGAPRLESVALTGPAGQLLLA